MKILIINDYGFQVGGVETYIAAIRNELSKKNSVKLFTTDLKIRADNYPDYTYSGLAGIPQFIINLLRAYNPFSRFALKSTLKEYRPDIVHIHHIFNHTSPSILSLLKDYPTIMTMHTQTLLCPMNKYDPHHGILKYNKFDHSSLKIMGPTKYYFNKVKYHFYAKYLVNVDLFLGVSKFISDEAARGGISPAETLYLGLDMPGYEPIKLGYNILFVGRLTQNKGVHVLISAFKKVIDKYPTSHLTIIGEGEEFNNLTKLVNDLKLNANITFTGKKSKNEIYKYLKKTQIVVVPSLWQEPFGLAGIEALSVGRPVIASKVGGIPEWLSNDVTGYLVDPGNPTELATKILYLFNNHNMLKKMSVKAKDSVKKYGIKDHVFKLSNIYAALIDRYKVNL